jgi:hypothetical protein
MRITLLDIAQKLMASKTAVSMALHNSHRISLKQRRPRIFRKLTGTWCGDQFERAVFSDAGGG